MTNSRRLIVLLLTFAVLLVGSERALAVTFSTGRTSQHGVARVFFAKPGVVISLIIELRTRCTDHKRRASLRARLTENAVTGSARVTQTLLATGVVCKSPWVTFSIPI